MGFPGSHYLMNMAHGQDPCDIIQFNYLLFMCRVNSYKVNYRHSANKIIIIIIVMGKVKTPFNYNVLTIMMIIIIIGQNNLLPISLI
jgi:hypothetical protein